MEIDIKAFCNELMRNMQENILPYWMDKMVDPAGGFYGRRDGNDNLVPDAPKGAILNGRLLWTFSAAYRVTGKAEYLKMAQRAKRYIIDNFYDKDFGGVYWSLNADGTPLDTKKQFYAIGFVIYGLSEFVRATGDDEALQYAMHLYHDIEHHSRDRQRGGYIEACTREWAQIDDMRLSDKDANEKKTMNTHLHIIEPYTNLYRVWRDDDLRESIVSLMDLFFDVMEDKKNHHLGLFFDEDWNRHDSEISYGHDIEASWLLLETAQVLGDEKMLEKALAHTRAIADAALQGRCTDGSMLYERHGNGTFDNEKHWWVQAECVIGQAYLYRYHGRADAVDRAAQTWNYIKNNIVDAESGEWYWSRKPDGSINRDDDKAGFWKCPYHNSRMCMEVNNTLNCSDNN
ncbi:MAG: AGE family epimerase/isomerase [Muribaculaceae bacterium]|jgi:cellobiose epimerase|nr:AGE family epimerase/isomerase [Muribaculaceae bacterium]